MDVMFFYMHAFYTISLNTVWIRQLYRHNFGHFQVMYWILSTYIKIVFHWPQCAIDCINAHISLGILLSNILNVSLGF